MMSSVWKRLLVMLLILPISCFTVFRVALFALESWDVAWRPAWSGDSSRAEVIVVLPTGLSGDLSTELIPWSSAQDFANEHPGCTFLIPVSRQGEVMDQLKAKYGISWISLQATPLSENKQEVLVEDMDAAKDVHGARYQASRTQVKLKSYRFIADGPGVGFMAMEVTIGVHIIVLGFIGALSIFKIYRQSRK
jgi:hypothetical protein